MSDGKECTCFASCYGECSCGADWTPDEVVRMRAENASLAAQNAKMREALNLFLKNNDTEGFGCACTPEHTCGPCRANKQQEPLRLALALPDLATPAINRIKAEGMREAAEICDTLANRATTASEAADELRAKANELEGKK